MVKNAGLQELNDTYLLTIAIPTYNRVDNLRITLPEVLKVIKNESIEIIVSDNCSTDTTEEYMKEMVRKHRFIKYYRNIENIGPDRNFLNCFNKASGEYVFLLGDDDLLLENGLTSLMEAIRMKPVFIHLNTSGIGKNMQGQTIIMPPRCVERGLLVYEDKNQLLIQMGIYITFLSSLVFRTEYVKMIEDKEKYIGTYFLQSHIVLRIMEHSGKYIFNTVNCCAATGNDKVYYDLFHVWGKQYGDLMFGTAIQSGFDKEVVEKVVHESFANNILDFVWYFRATCRNEKKWKRNDLWLYVNRFPDLKMRYRCAVMCPHFLIRIRILAIRAMNYLKRMIVKK